MTSASKTLIDFYCGAGTDHHGRSLATILRMGDAQLERTHDYIQWLLPTVTASQFSPDGPCLDAATATRLRADPLAQSRLQDTLRRILDFYGLELDESDAADPEISPGRGFDAHARARLSPDNHNYRRLTRILASLVVLGRRPQAEALYRCLESLYRRSHCGEIGNDTISHWRRQPT